MQGFDYSKETKEIQDAFYKYLIESEIYFDDVIMAMKQFKDLLKTVEAKACYSHPHSERVSFGIRD